MAYLKFSNIAVQNRSMRIILFLLVCFSSIICLAQDPEYTDYRRKSESFLRIVDKSVRADLASFTIGGIEESLGKSPLKKLPVKNFGDNYITYDSNDIKVTIQSGVFRPDKHKYTYEGKYLVKIDNKPYYGNYTKMPRTTIEKVTVVFGKDTVAIPANAIADLYNPNFTYSSSSGELMSQDAVYISPDKSRLYIYMLNKDETGSYEVTWVIQDKKYLRRVLDFGFSK